MRKKMWLTVALLALPVALAGLAYGQTLSGTNQPHTSAEYVCPLTGEDLPCPKCCPVNGRQ